MSFSPVEKEVLGKLTPGELPGTVQSMIERVQKLVPKANVILGGSTAKGTHLAGDYDIDIFVAFPKGTKEISDKLEQAIEELKPERIHGSRDYFQVKAGKYTVELVPVLEITTSKEAENVTDMSPLHAQYVTTKLKELQLNDDIRLAKQFCKAARVYGAESHIGGFSGYVVEVLTIHYGGFTKLLEAINTWEERTVIDPEQQLKNPEEELNESKTFSPLIIVDPVQKERNAAAAVTEEKYNKLKEHANTYLLAPTKNAFTITKLTKKEVQTQYPNANIISITITPVEGKNDVAGAKCQKVFEFILGQLYMHEVIVYGAEWEFAKKANLFFAVDKEPLSKEQEILGPPLELKEDVKRFKARHKNTRTGDERIIATEKRKFTNPEQIIKHVLQTPYVKERVTDAS